MMNIRTIALIGLSTIVSSLLTIVPGLAATEGSFGGTPAAVPGTVQAENYDTGGEGLGYHVTALNGSANSYRTDGIDIEPCSDTGGGVDLGWTSAGQWFRYTVSVATAGTYKVGFRTACFSTAGALHLQNSAGTNLSGSVTVPVTGGWQTWSTVNATVTLPAGTQTLTVIEDSGGFNLNSLIVTPPAPGGLSATAGNTTVNLAWNSSAGASTYNVYLGTAAGQESTSPIAGGLTGTTYLSAGLANGTPYYYKVAAVNATGTSPLSSEARAVPNNAFGGTPGTVPGTLQAENYDLGGQGVAYNVATNSGTLTTYRTDGVDLETCSDTGGGADLGWTSPGQWFKYTVNVSTAGAYTASFRVACGGSGGMFHIANAAGTSLTGPVTALYTGGYQTWTTVMANLNLPSGQQVLTLVVDAGNFNINYCSFTSGATNLPVDFGPNVLIFNPGMSMSSIQAQLNNIWSQQKSNQFGTQRYAYLFKPGTYALDVPVGYYIQALGLGTTPDSVLINGKVEELPEASNNNATCNFWSGVENMAVNPSSSFGSDVYAVSQADPMRRVHIKGNLALSINGGISSGGFLADSVVDGQIQSGTQQQWLSRNCQWGSWNGGTWNMVFVGDPNYAGGTFPSYTNVSQTPVIREKPFLQIDGAGNYSVFVPGLRSNSSATTWSGSTEAGTAVPISSFYIAKSSFDNAATINSALSKGKNILLTPGVYVLNGTINVNNPNTVVLGIGLATLQANSSQNAMQIADVDGVTVAGILFETASTVNTLLQVGPSGSSAAHSANPTLLSDVFFRVGGAVLGTCSTSLAINSSNVIGDNFWVWRADHDNGTGTVGWNTNTAANGVVVNGQNVTVYGLFVEHCQQYQTLWNGNGGRVYMYQSECPYDVPNEASWTGPYGVQGWASYKVADSVTSHQGYGVGVYAYFSANPSVTLQNAIECPANVAGVQFTDMVTISMTGTIWNIINYTGNNAASWNTEASLLHYP